MLHRRSIARSSSSFALSLIDAEHLDRAFALWQDHRMTARISTDFPRQTTAHKA